MTPSPRAELFETLAELCRRYPDWRLGQLIANVSGWADQDLWDIEDEQLFAAGQAHLQQLARREAEGAAQAQPG